ncbi:MAG: hypothetical protein F4059_09500 [Gemmatimonadetes bacterium]|nr:hypothetical protein [Gemmatimonadota bacterium]
MRTRAMVMPAGAVLLCACASGGSPGTEAAPAALVPAEPTAGHTLTYDVPSPPTATYAISDTTVTVMNATGSDMDMTMGSAATLELTFEHDADGLLISGSLLEFGSSMSGGIMPTVTSGLDDLEGDFEILLGPRGRVQIRSLPRSSDAATGATLMTAVAPLTFLAFATSVFPRFPDGPVAFGDSWADTADVSNDQADLAGADDVAGVAVTESSGTTITTYTLVGDTVVAGRRLLHISLKVDGTMASAGEAQGMETTVDMTNVADGSFLWDPERRLLTAVELRRTTDTTTMMQDMAMTMTAVATLTLRLVN